MSGGSHDASGEVSQLVVAPLLSTDQAFLSSGNRQKIKRSRERLSPLLAHIVTSFLQPVNRIGLTPQHL